MNYTISQINRDFLLNVETRENGIRNRRLVGVSTLVSLIGVDLLNKFVARAYRDSKDVCVCRLRRGMVVSLYAY